MTIVAAKAQPVVGTDVDPGPIGETPRVITDAIDESDLISLTGNTHPKATHAHDRGALADEQVIEHMHLQLRRSAAATAAAAAFVAAQYDPASPQFQHWLTAEEFGARFGPAQDDIATVSQWLAAHGLSVNYVYPSRMVVDFSGTVRQVARTFRTEIHRFDVDGRMHYANVSNPQIPAALGRAVAGIVSLHDFRAHAKHTVRPRYSDSAGDRLITPADLATIYDVAPAFAAGHDGRGQVIATVEDTNLYANADWTTFRRVFGLASYTLGTLVVSHPAPKGGKACGNPGVNADGDDIEAALDVEWASAAAPNAEIMLASCAASGPTDPIYLAIQNLVNSPSPVPIISVSYGVCEAENGQTMNAAFATLYQQAAAEGISVYVATGDNGPSDCADSGDAGARYGIGANGWATTQYNVAVGGTDFSDTYAGSTADYWATTNSATHGSAKSYIPEIPWNENCGSVLIAKYFGATSLTYGASGFCNIQAGQQFQTLAGGEGAPSGCATGTPSRPGIVSGSCRGTPKPSWQNGILGNPADGVRDIPDVALFAASGIWSHSYITCFSDPNNGGSPCVGDPGTWQGGGGGTSYATPIWAGIQALINQQAGKRQGLPTPTLYRLAAAQFGASGDAGCSASLGKQIGAACIFHDVTLGDNDSDCVSGGPNCYRPSGTLGVLSLSASVYQPAYKAGVGWDFPTGLGSVDVAKLLAKWP